VSAHDGFGRRHSGTDADSGEAIERLDLAPELVQLRYARRAGARWLRLSR